MISRANEIIREAAEKLEAAGVPRGEVGHALVGAGLAILEIDLCTAHYVQAIAALRDMLATRIEQARAGSPVGEVH